MLQESILGDHRPLSHPSINGCLPLLVYKSKRHQDTEPTMRNPGREYVEVSTNDQ
jgi:hypothetical protein